MFPTTSPSHLTVRCLFLCALALLLLGGVLTAGQAGAGEAGPVAQVVSRGSRPTTETMRQMVAREPQYRAAARVRGARLQRRPEAPAPARDAGRNAAEGAELGADALPVAGVQAVQALGAGFEGVNATNPFAVPRRLIPDAGGAMGPDHYVQVVDGLVTVFDRNGNLLSRLDGGNFFNLDLGGITLPRVGIEYVRVLYDRRSGRWFACGVEISNSQFNHTILAVSRTSDPAGAWDKYLIQTGQASSGGFDFVTTDATLGLDDNGVYIGATLERRNGSTGGLSASIPLLACTAKAPLLAATPSIGVVTRFELPNQDIWASPQVPQNFDAIGPQAPTYVVNSSFDINNSNNVRFRTLTWNAGAPTLSNLSGVNTPDYGFVVSGASQGSNLPLDLGDDRLQGSVIRNGRLWTCRTVGVNATGGATGSDRAACEWLELQTAPAGTLSLVQSGRVFIPQAAPRFCYQPSLAVSGQGHMALGFHASRAEERISFYTCGRLAGDPLGTVGVPTLVRGGEASWLDSTNGAMSPWGRFTQTCVDPTDDQTLWTLGNYPRPFFNSSIWASHINSLRAPAPQITSATNAAGFIGQTGVSFTLTGAGCWDPGAGFARRASVVVSGAGISNAAVTVNSPTLATVTLNLAANAALGARNITFTNPDGQSSTLPGAFTVTEAPVIQFSAATYAATEANGQVGLTIQRSSPITHAATVRYTTASGTGTADSDFPAIDATVTFNPGTVAVSFPLIVTNDSLLEGAETANLQLSNVQGAILGNPSSAVVTIADNLAKPAPTNLTAGVAGGQVALQWADHCENEDGFLVESSTDGGATFQTAGTAGANAAGASLSGLAAGAIRLRVRAFRGAIQSNPSNTVTLQLATVQLSAATFSGSELGGTVPVTITRAGNLASTSVLLTTSNGTATAPGDYVGLANTTVNFAANETSRTVSVVVNPDQLLEGDETLNLALSSPTGANALLGAQVTATASIVDDLARPAPTNLTATLFAFGVNLQWEDHCENDDRMVVVGTEDGGAPFEFVIESNSTSFALGLTGGVSYTFQVRAARTNASLQSDPSNTVTVQVGTVQFSADTIFGTEAGGTAAVTLVRTGNLGVTASVVLTSADNDAAAPEDYTAHSNTTVSFAANEASRTVNIGVNADQALEGDETFYLTLSNPTGANVIVGSESLATITITDNPASCTPTNLTAVPVGLAAVQLTWADNCTNESSYLVERSVGGAGFTTVATVGANVTTAQDTTAAPGATLTYRVRAVQGTLQSSNSATATTEIFTVQFNAAAFSGTEAGGTVQAIVTRTGGLGAAASVTLNTGDGTAVSPGDYAAQAGTVVNFGPNDVSKTVNITLNADQALEGEETFTLTLSSPAGGILGTQSTATATVADNAAAATPTNLTAFPVGPTTIRLAWADNCTNETGYQLERSTGGGAFTVVGTAPANATTTQDTTAMGGTAFTYRVRAFQGQIQGGASSEVQATIPLGAVAKITPAKLNFGKVKLGKTKTLKVTIQNTSKTGTMAGFVSLTGAAGYTLVGGDRPFTLLPKKKLVVSVSFAPPAAGAAAGTVTVLTTATNKPNTAVPLTGTGK